MIGFAFSSNQFGLTFWAMSYIFRWLSLSSSFLNFGSSVLPFFRLPFCHLSLSLSQSTLLSFSAACTPSYATAVMTIVLHRSKQVVVYFVFLLFSCKLNSFAYIAYFFIWGCGECIYRRANSIDNSEIQNSPKSQKGGKKKKKNLFLYQSIIKFE